MYVAKQLKDTGAIDELLDQPRFAYAAAPPYQYGAAGTLQYRCCQ